MTGPTRRRSRYGAAPWEPGRATGLLLDAVARVQPPEGAYRSGVEAQVEAVTADGLADGHWSAGAPTTWSGDGLSDSAKALFRAAAARLPSAGG